MPPLKQTLDITGGFANPAQIEKDLQSPEMLARVGNAVVMVLKSHFIALNAQRTHGFGGSDGYYEGAARGTGYTTDLGYPAVVVNQIGIALRYYGTEILPGGKLRPKNAKYLSIPNSFSSALSQVYGRSPTEFGNLHVVFGRRKDGTIGPIALAGGEGGAHRQNHVLDPNLGTYEKVGEKGKKVRVPLSLAEQGMAKNVHKKTKSSEGEILFWLVKEVYQAPDATVLPPIERLVNAGREAAVDYIAQTTPASIVENGQLTYTRPL